MQEPKPPIRLYKYQKFNNYSIKNLKNTKIYFNRPIDFNDPFDITASMENIEYTNSDVVEYYNKSIDEGKLGNSRRVTKYSEIPETIINQIESAIDEIAKSTQEKRSKKTGCSCFSETNKDILMWSHYADGHRGFCLEFDTSFDPFNNAIKVDYKEDYQTWNPFTIMMNKNEEEQLREFRKPLRHKFESWRYEKEWRIFHEEPQVLYGYKVKALTAVYFGLAIDYADLEIICLILLGQNPDIKFYKAIRDKKPYKVNFENDFKYIPYKDTIEQTSLNSR